MFNNFQEVELFFLDRKSFGIKLGLDRMQTLLQLVGSPEKKINGIHVAGTNGKGSTIQYMKNALMQNDYKVGVFISPSPNEMTGHIFMNDNPIKKEAFTRLLNDMYPFINILDAQNQHPTEFEIITVLAFLYFAGSTDIALIETGMGGREDTTNCFLPLLSIITNVSRDHMTFLGNTVEEIAFHKAGIIKHHVPAIIGPMQGAALKVIEQAAAAVQTKLFRYNQTFFITEGSGDQAFMWQGYLNNRLTVSIRMMGKHQQVNASLAVMALIKLAEQGFTIHMKKALEGIQQTVFHGRFEPVSKSPRIILDGAHNEAGIRSLIEAAALIETSQKKHVLFAAFKDKDIQTMLTLLQNYFDTVTLTTFDHPRAATVEELVTYAQSDQIIVAKKWQDAVKIMDTGKLYFITGSLHFIAKVRNFIANR